MTTTTITSHADLAATIPAMLGFQPEESAVLVFEKDGAVVCTARVDLDSAAVTAACARVAEREPTSVSLVIYTQQDATSAASHVERFTAVIDKWVSRCHGGYVHSNTYYTSGQAPQTLTHTPAAVAAFTTAGVVTAATRDEAMAMVTAIRPDPAVAAELDTATIPATSQGRRQVEDAIVEHLTSHDQAPAPATVAAWLICMNASTIREPVLKRLSESDTNARDSAGRMLALVQSAPRVEQTAAATALAAALLWLTGDCARASALAQEATRANPANVLGQLVTQACNAGVSPEVFTGMLADMSLEQLRTP